MEFLRCHGVTVEIPLGLTDAEREAFVQAFVAETPSDLTPEEGELHAELFLATHARPSAVPSAPAAVSAPHAVPTSAVDVDDEDLED